MRLKKLLLTAGLAATSLFAALPRAQATTCANATAITSLPVTNQALVCGTTDDQSATSIVQNCNGSTFYYGGLEALYTFTPTITGTVRVEYTGQSWTGIFIYSGCPSTTGTTVVACTTSSATSKFIDVPVTSGQTYYLMFDTWPSPASPCAGTFSILLPCNGMPTAGTASATVTSTCPGGTSVLSLAGQSAGPGISYQWQSSTTSATTGFSNVAGATAATYTTALLSATTYYRAIIKCTTTNDSVIANTLTVTVTPPTTTTATIPYSQSFETWISTCSTTDRPGTEWTTVPFNGQEAWRRDDQGASANWTTPTGGIYSPTFTAGAYSARFHSYYTSGQGSMLLNVNLSPAGTKLISFHYNNTSGTDSLYVEISANGGTSYTVLAALGTATGWAIQNVPTTSTAANAIIRFRAKGDFGFSTDIGMDNLNIALVTCPPIASPVVSTITSNTANVNWVAPTPAPALGYRYELRTSGAAGSGATGLVQSNTVPNTTTSLSLTGLTGSTAYTIYVRAICSAGDSSAWASAAFLTNIDCSAATAISACGIPQSFSIPAGQGAWGGYIQTPTGNAPYQTPGVEKLYTFTAPVTGVYTLSVTTTNSQWVDYFFKPVTATACANSGWTFIDDVFSAPNNVTFTLTGGTQYYILADPESTTSAPAQTFQIICPPTCGTPITLTATTSTNSATLGWTQQLPGSPATWQISYGTGITTPGAGTMVIANTNPWTITGLTPATNYTFYVRAICGPGDTSAWSAAYTTQSQCLPSALPFAEDFVTFLPACWSRATGFLTAAPSALVSSTGNGWTNDGYMNNGTTGATKINLYSNFRRDWLISPTIDLGTTPSNYVMEFNMAVPVWNSTTAYDTLGSDDTVAVVVSYNNGATWSLADALKVWTAADDTITSSRYYLPFTGSGQIKIGFYGGDGLVDDAPDMDIFFDSVRVTQCLAPTVALGNDTTLCGTGASLILDAGPGTSFVWSTGDTSQSVIISNPGTYTVTVFNGGPGCSKIDTINVNTGTIPVVNLGPDTSVCGNVASFQLNAGNPGANYSWSSPASPLPFTTQIIDLGPIINAGNTTNSGSPTNTAPVIASVTNAAGCTGRDTVNVSVIFTARVSDFTMTGTDPTFLFTPVLDSFATTYAWTFGDGGTSTSPAPSHTYTTNGSYTVRLTVGNQCGVTDTVIKTRPVTNDVKDVTADGTTISLYPNPTAADAVLSVEGGAKLRGYQVLNAAGAVVAERTLDGLTRTTLNTNAFAPGVYTLRIQLDKGVVVRKLEVIK